ncbi:hypothetical protein [Actinomyces marmotae]|uniref:hypothetical protein n=1 Tax=Actinomyces marmotae TaxID=2737173 RepID=UPI00135C15DC|nr:hypothetical protein [Actinomyces marmotae]
MTKSAAAIEQELAETNARARTLRNHLKRARAEELLSAKTALGEALAEVCFAESPEAMRAVIENLDDPATADEVRRVLGVDNAENDAPKEPQDEPQWGSDAGDDQAGTDVPPGTW